MKSEKINNIYSFSIIMPVYNGENYIGESIKSILAQTHENWELIVVDDGSTDNTIDIVHSFEDRRIKLYRQRNSGVSAARNYGISNATAEYVAFLDADDNWGSTYLETIAYLIEKYPNCIGYATNYFFVDKDNNKKLPIIKDKNKSTEHYIITNYLETIYTSDPLFCVISIVLKKQELLLINGFPVNIKGGEDTITWIKLSLIGNFAYCSNALCNYNIPDPGDRKIRTPEDVDSFEIEIRALMESYPKDKEHLQNILSHWYKIRASTYLQHGKKKLARKYTYKAFRFSQVKMKLLIYFIFTLLPMSVSQTGFNYILKKR